MLIRRSNSQYLDRSFADEDNSVFHDEICGESSLEESRNYLNTDLSSKLLNVSGTWFSTNFSEFL